MGNCELLIGAFQPITEESGIAEVSGDDVIKCADLLGSLLRNKDPVLDEQLTSDERIDELVIAVNLSGALEIARRLKRLNDDIHLVAFSRAGALAVNVAGEDVPHSLIDQIESLDEYNRILIISPS